MPLLTPTSRLGRGGSLHPSGDDLPPVSAPAAAFADFRFVAGSEYAQSGEATFFQLFTPGDNNGDVFWQSVGTAVQPSTGVIGSPTFHAISVTGLFADEVYAANAQAVVDTGKWSVPGFRQRLTIAFFDFESPAADGTTRQSGITYDSADWVNSTSFPKVGSQCLFNTVNDAGTVYYAFIDAASPAGRGDATELSTWWRGDTSVNTVFSILLRCASKSGAANAWQFSLGITNGISILYTESGVNHFLVSGLGSGAGVFAPDTYYKARLIANGSSLKAEMLRADGKYLTSSAAWQDSQAYCADFVDSHVPGADGQFAGILVYQGEASCASHFDQLLYEAI